MTKKYITITISYSDEIFEYVFVLLLQKSSNQNTIYWIQSPDWSFCGYESSYSIFLLLSCHTKNMETFKINIVEIFFHGAMKCKPQKNTTLSEQFQISNRKILERGKIEYN